MSLVVFRVSEFKSTCTSHCPGLPGQRPSPGETIVVRGPGVVAPELEIPEVVQLSREDEPIGPVDQVAVEVPLVVGEWENAPAAEHPARLPLVVLERGGDAALRRLRLKAKVVDSNEGLVS